MQRRNSKETTGQHSANGNRFDLKCELLTKVFFNKNSDVVLLIFIQTLVRKDFCHVRCNWYSISEVGHISENGNKWSTTLVNHKPYIFFCENFPSFIIHTEKYREFQARFSLFFIFENIYYLNSKSKRCLEEQCCKCIEDKNFSKKEFWRGLNLIW